MLSQDEKELLKGVQDDPPPKSYSQPMLWLLGIILAVIMTSYIFLAPTIQDNLAGYIQSSVILENKIESGDTTIHISEEVKETVQSYYTRFPDVETALCLQGTHRNQTVYNITDVYQPTTYSAGFTYVRHEPCDEDTVVMFHTHPERRCQASPQDRVTLEQAQQEQPEMRMLIMCEPRRFNIVT